MKNSEIEDNLIKLNADIIDIKARVQALQDVFFGSYSADNRKDVSDGLKELFQEFYDNLLRKHTDAVPEGRVKDLTRKWLQIE